MYPERRKVGELFKILTGKPTGNKPLERPRSRWEDNIRMDLKQIVRPTHTRN